MKYLLIIIIALTGCNKFSCPPKQYIDFKYNDHVVVTNGFYKGQAALIKERTEIYRTTKCNLEAFKIELDNDKNIVNVDQYDLIKKNPSALLCKDYPFCELSK